MIEFKETDIFIEICIELNGKKIGTAEVNPDNRELTRFEIYEPYQNMGYGQEALKNIMLKYDIKKLWVESCNAKAIHVYEKSGFRKAEETMFCMKV